MVGHRLASGSPVSHAEMVNAIKAGNPAGNSPDPRRYRALYPDKWHGFLHAHFLDAQQVGYFFGVSERTARDWWEGVTRSQGWAVAYAIESIPTAREYLRAA